MIGFQKLMCLRLDGQPADDMIEGTVQAWLEALTHNRVWDRARDEDRVRSAFRVLASTRRAWPAPADLFDALPRFEPIKALPARVADPERALAAIEEVRALLNPSDQEVQP